VISQLQCVPNATQVNTICILYSYFPISSLLNYLSHCYTIAWDRLSNQFFCLCMYLCVYVCMYVSVGTLTVAFSTDLHQIWNEPLGSESEELVRLGSKSKNAFPYFSPKNQNFGGANRHFKPNLQKFQIVISSKLYIGLA